MRDGRVLGVCDRLQDECVRERELLGQVCDGGKSPSFGAMWTQVGAQPTSYWLCVWTETQFPHQMVIVPTGTATASETNTEPSAGYS